MKSFVPDPLVIPGFLPDLACDALINAYKTSPLYKGKLAYWNDRVVYPTGNVQLVTNYYIEQSKKLLEPYFKLSLAWETSTLVSWKPGVQLIPHIDNQKLDGTPNDTPDRIISQIIYLNDNYEGGETFFPNLNDLKITPKRGTLVGFHSGPKHLHGVKKVMSGIRYTFTAWYTEKGSVKL